MNKQLNFGGDLDQGSGSEFGYVRIRIRIATMVRHALVEVCTVPVLLVMACFDAVGWALGRESGL